MDVHMKILTRILIVAALGLGLAACDQGPSEDTHDNSQDVEPTALAGGHTPTVPSIECEVTTDPNKGKKGKRTEDGWCEGDWGGTECKPRSKCKDVASGTAGAVVGLLEAHRDEVDAGPGFGNPVVGIVPPHGSPRVDYCKRDENFLSVVFTNTGVVDAPSGTDVLVTFFTDTNQSMTQVRPRPLIPANGGIVDMVYEIPPGCFGPDCSFEIKWSNQPIVRGICIG